jgi:large subunit ribosomal protein L13
MTIIDAENSIMGRLATQVAQRLNKGEKIDIINAEKMIIIGTKKNTLHKYTTRRNMQAKGNPYKGPKYPRTVEGIAKRSIEGMLPQQTQRKKNASKKLKIHKGTPKEFENKPKEKIKQAEMQTDAEYMHLHELSKALGAKP